jgi:hypothetical protein
MMSHCLCFHSIFLNLLCNHTMRATRSFQQVSSRHRSHRVVLRKANAYRSSQPQVTTVNRPASWRLYTCRMPLVGLEGVAAALKNTPVASLLQLHTYLLLEGPDDGADQVKPTLSASPNPRQQQQH